MVQFVLHLTLVLTKMGLLVRMLLTGSTYVLKEGRIRFLTCSRLDGFLKALGCQERKKCVWLVIFWWRFSSRTFYDLPRGHRKNFFCLFAKFFSFLCVARNFAAHEKWWKLPRVSSRASRRSIPTMRRHSLSTTCHWWGSRVAWRAKEGGVNSNFREASMLHSDWPLTDPIYMIS